MSNQQPGQNQSKKSYVCVHGITSPHPDHEDRTKILDSRCLHHRPGTTVQLTDADAASLLKRGAIKAA
jgi:hypothetical protein